MANDTVFDWSLLEEGTAQAEVLVNELLARIIAGLVRVNSYGDNTPPGSPDNFDAYVIGSSPTDDWVGHDDEIAVYLDGWKYFAPTKGVRVYVDDIADMVIEHDGTDWAAIYGSQALVDGTTIPWPLDGGNTGSVTIEGNRTMVNPTNHIVNGRIYFLRITQGSGGSKTLAYGNAYIFAGGSAPSLSSGAGEVDVLLFIGFGNSLYHFATQLDVGST